MEVKWKSDGNQIEDRWNSNGSRMESDGSQIKIVCVFVKEDELWTNDSDLTHMYDSVSSFSSRLLLLALQTLSSSSRIAIPRK